MNKKLLWESLLYLLLLVACILLVINFILLKTDAGECVRKPKEFLLKHFEELTEGNVSCSCMTDNPDRIAPDSSSRGYMITFSSQDYPQGISSSPFSQELKNISLKSP